MLWPWRTPQPACHCSFPAPDASLLPAAGHEPKPVQNEQHCRKQPSTVRGYIENASERLKAILGIWNGETQIWHDLTSKCFLPINGCCGLLELHLSLSLSLLNLCQRWDSLQGNNRLNESSRLSSAPWKDSEISAVGNLAVKPSKLFSWTQLGLCFFWCFGAFHQHFLHAAGPGLTCSVFSVWCWWCLNALYTTFKCWRAWRCSFSPASRLSLLLCGKEERTCEALASIPPIQHAKHIAYREHSTMHSSTTQSIPAAQQKPYPAKVRHTMSSTQHLDTTHFSPRALFFPALLWSCAACRGNGIVLVCWLHLRYADGWICCVLLSGCCLLSWWFDGSLCLLNWFAWAPDCHVSFPLSGVVGTTDTQLSGTAVLCYAENQWLQKQGGDREKRIWKNFVFERYLQHQNRRKNSQADIIC